MAKAVDEKAIKEKAPRPNKPSFDFNPDTGKPNILPGEEVIIAKEKQGVPVYVTNQGRVIFVCSLDEFEEKFNPLLKRFVFEQYYPQAISFSKKAKLVDLTAKDAPAATPSQPSEDKAGKK